MCVHFRRIHFAEEHKTTAMSSESDYLLERIPTNASKGKSPLPSGRLAEIYTDRIKNSWIVFIHFIGRHYIAEFLATFVLMVS